jgi:DNA protecting protein DprA
MLVMLGCKGVQPGRWLGYAQYITQNASFHGSVALMTQWPNPESVLQAVAKPELDPWRQSIRQAKSPPLPKSAWLLGQTAPQYSPLLAECQDAPPFLFGLGDPSCFDCPAIAIVGSRRPSLDGLKLAERFAFELAQAGFVIVSGLAQGVDTAAHKGALAAGGRTIAVMATGIDTVYPSANRALSAGIAESGAVVTEFLPGSAPKRHHFRRRNRTISGLSIATVVIEAGVPSGTLITATAAAEQGRDVYALPWSINHKQGEGCLKLLLEGAMLATDPHDIIEGSCWSKPIPPEAVLKNYRASQGVLEGFGEQNTHGAAEQTASLRSENSRFESFGSKGGRGALSALSKGLSSQKEVSEQRQSLSDEQKALLQLMGDGYHSAESLSVAMGSDIRDMHQALTALEISNLVTRHRSGYCKR